MTDAPTLKVLVASQNKEKLDGVENAFRLHYPDHVIDITGIECPSGVNPQPIGRKETILGAENRLRYLQKMYMRKAFESDYLVSIESGLIDNFGHTYIIVIQEKYKLVVSRKIDGWTRVVTHPDIIVKAFDEYQPRGMKTTKDFYTDLFKDKIDWHVRSTGVTRSVFIEEEIDAILICLEKSEL